LDFYRFDSVTLFSGLKLKYLSWTRHEPYNIARVRIVNYQAKQLFPLLLSIQIGININIRILCIKLISLFIIHYNTQLLFKSIIHNILQFNNSRFYLKFWLWNLDFSQFEVSRFTIFDFRFWPLNTWFVLVWQ